jgi:hypothetical protein
VLPATPERHKEKRLGKLARKPKVDWRPSKKAENRSHSHKNQATKGKNLLPLAQQMVQQLLQEFEMQGKLL